MEGRREEPYAVRFIKRMQNDVDELPKEIVEGDWVEEIPKGGGEDAGVVVEDDVGGDKKLPALKNSSTIDNDESIELVDGTKHFCKEHYSFSGDTVSGGTMARAFGEDREFCSERKSYKCLSELATKDSGSKELFNNAIDSINKKLQLYGLKVKPLSDSFLKSTGKDNNKFFFSRYVSATRIARVHHEDGTPVKNRKKIAKKAEEEDEPEDGDDDGSRSSKKKRKRVTPPQKKKTAAVESKTDVKEEIEIGNANKPYNLFCANTKTRCMKKGQESYHTCRVLSVSVVKVVDEAKKEFYVKITPLEFFPHNKSCMMHKYSCDHDDMRKDSAVIMKFPREEIFRNVFDDMMDRFGKWDPKNPLPPGWNINFKTEEVKTDYDKEVRKYLPILTGVDFYKECMEPTKVYLSLVRFYMWFICTNNCVEEYCSSVRSEIRASRDMIERSPFMNCSAPLNDVPCPSKRISST